MPRGTVADTDFNAKHTRDIEKRLKLAVTKAKAAVGQAGLPEAERNLEHVKGNTLNLNDLMACGPPRHHAWVKGHSPHECFLGSLWRERRRFWRVV